MNKFDFLRAIFANDYPLAESETTGLWYAVSAFVGFVLGGAVLHGLNMVRKRDVKSQAAKIVEQAEIDAANKMRQSELNAKEKLLQLQSKFDSDLQKQRNELRKKESVLDRRDESLQQSTQDLKKQERFVEANQNKLTAKVKQTEETRRQLNDALSKQQTELQRVTGLSIDDAKTQLLTILEKDLQGEMGATILKHQRKFEEKAELQAREILLTVMQRYASSQTAESTTSTVDIPNDDLKGRIIGREGRNIRAFEKATGIDVIIDDTPGVVIVSGFDPVRREIARASLEKLITDGRIHPARIEEIVSETSSEIERFMRKKGQEAAEEVNVTGLHDRVIDMLGRLHFRTSYSQNVLRHSIEVSFLSGMLAEMVGLDPVLARRCGLLHDIGKAADHELEGGHPKIGADFLKRHGENGDVVHAALGHHDLFTTEYPYTLLVATGDACSASRPGARRESLERYIKRMEELETIAKQFDGVEQAFAIQAGRELRVIASAKKTDDASAAKICRDIAKAFEQQLTYPGEIRVTVVRESRFMETAR